MNQTTTLIVLGAIFLVSTIIVLISFLREKDAHRKTRDDLQKKIRPLKDILIEVKDYLRHPEENPLFADDLDGKRALEEVKVEARREIEGQLTAAKSEVAKTDPRYIAKLAEVADFEKDLAAKQELQKTDPSQENDGAVRTAKTDFSKKKEELSKLQSEIAGTYNGTFVLEQLAPKLKLITDKTVDAEKLKEFHVLEMRNKDLMRELGEKEKQVLDLGNELFEAKKQLTTPDDQTVRIKELEIAGFNKDITIAGGKLIGSMETALAKYGFYIKNASENDSEEEKSRVESEYCRIAEENLEKSYRDVSDFNEIDTRLTADWNAKEKEANPFFRNVYETVFGKITGHVYDLLTKRINELKASKDVAGIHDLVKRLDNPWTNKGMLLLFTIKLSKLLELLEDLEKESAKAKSTGPGAPVQPEGKPRSWTQISLTAEETAGKNREEIVAMKKLKWENWGKPAATPGTDAAPASVTPKTGDDGSNGQSGTPVTDNSNTASAVAEELEQ